MLRNWKQTSLLWRCVGRKTKNLWKYASWIQYESASKKTSQIGSLRALCYQRPCSDFTWLWCIKLQISKNSKCCKNNSRMNFSARLKKPTTHRDGKLRRLHTFLVNFRPPDTPYAPSGTWATPKPIQDKGLDRYFGDPCSRGYRVCQVVWNSPRTCAIDVSWWVLVV